MTDAGVLEVVETLDHLDFEEPCVASTDDQPCPNPVQWNLVCGFCGFTGPTCEPHRSAVDQLAAVADMLICHSCTNDMKTNYRWEHR